MHQIFTIHCLSYLLLCNKLPQSLATDNKHLQPQRLRRASQEGLLWAFCEETGWRYAQVKGSLQGRSHNCQTPQRLLLPPEAPGLLIQVTAYGCTWHGSFLPSVGHKDRWKQLLIKLRLPWIMGCQRHSTTSPIKQWAERLLQWRKR